MQGARFKRFVRVKKDKKAVDKLSTSPTNASTSMQSPSMTGKADDEKKSTWSRVGWGRMGSSDRRGPGEQGGHRPQFTFPADLMALKLDSVPSDVYFLPLVDSSQGSSRACIEGPDAHESELVIRNDALSDTFTNNCHDQRNARACGQSISTYPRVLALPGARLGKTLFIRCALAVTVRDRRPLLPPALVRR